MVFDGELSIAVPSPENVDMILTFDLLTSKSSHFSSVANSTFAVN